MSRMSIFDVFLVDVSYKQIMSYLVINFEKSLFVFFSLDNPSTFQLYKLISLVSLSYNSYASTSFGSTAKPREPPGTGSL